MPQFLPTASNPTLPIPRQQASSSTTDDALANLREEMAKKLRDNFGVELPRNRIYQKPYPEYFDAIQCPPGYNQILLSLMEKAQKPHGNMLVNI